MTAVAEKIMKTALSLSPADRAELLEQLFISFDPAPDPAVEQAWKEEADSRYMAYKRGEIASTPAEEVFARIFAK